MRLRDDQNYIPTVIVLWGSRSAQVRIFTDYLVAVREQEYQGYFHYLLDFRNGTWEYPIDNYRCHYACLTIIKIQGLGEISPGLKGVTVPEKEKD